MWNRLLGLDAGQAADVVGLALRSNWPTALLGVLVVAAVIYAVVLYRRERLLRPAERIVLTVLRAAALALLAVVLFQPVLRVRVSQEVPGNVLVLLDSSESMEIRDPRKAPAALAEAGMALGKVAGDDPNRMQAALRAERAMQRAAAAMARDDIAAADDAITRADGQLNAAAEAISTDPGAEAFARRLAEIRQSQREIDRSLAAVRADQLPGLARRQRELAETLDQWEQEVHAARLTVPEALKPDLALVSRMEIVRGLLNHTSGSVFAPLARDHTTRYFRFGRGLSPLGTTPGEAREALGRMDAPANRTELGEAIREAVAGFADEPLSGVVLITDGAANGETDPLTVAGQLARRDVPVYTVGIGLPEPDDLAVRGLVVQDVVFSGDIVPVRVQVLSSGYEKRTTMLSVLMDGVRVAQKPITLTGKPQFEELTFTVARTGGSKTLEVNLAPLGDEATIENNVVSKRILAVDDKVKVLCIEGSPRWEFRYLRAILKRDPRIEPTFLTTEGDRELARASDEHIARFPERLKDAFEYDLVILGDVRPTHFTPTQLETLQRLIREHGSSMIVLAGHKHMPAAYLNTPVAEMLPVWTESGTWQDVGEEVYPELTRAGHAASVMTLVTGEARNQAIWTKAKPLTSVAPVTRAKDGATIWAVLSDSAGRAEPVPLIAWHRYGNGKVLFVGTDRLWRLRAKVGDAHHAKFWGQAIQFLSLSRLLGENRRIRLEVAGGDAQVGRPVEVFASVLNDSYEPASGRVLPVRVSGGESDPAGRTLTLQAVPNMPGLFHGLLVPEEPGAYTITPAGDEQTAGGQVQFTVSETPAEQQNAAMNRQMLRQLAAMTDGQYVPLHRLGVLPALLADRATETSTLREFALWDLWIVLVVIGGLVAIEWAWRRNRDLA